ncbi:DUF4843 domain-containing protein [Zhouia spongiae]|uniref:DUF4843 domain-containing protein n=1 Tax=Zhouia spongiae TaxID=2202721 RepID=A0ABY3YLM1_9FLAO|nr:DUF4843 domain-containing protein [Zhouia spongiae]UNY98515.1 DUF4843 domain-containing protein [Zhouia spongiae]
MKNKIIYIGLVCCYILAISCSTDEIDTFNTKDNVYFTWAEKRPDNTYPHQYIDSLGMTFAFMPQTTTDIIFKLPISVQGKLSQQAREVDVKVREESTAKKGVHFDFPDQLTLRANSHVDSIPITLYRTPDMKSSTFTLALELVANENFSVNMEDKIIDEQTGETRNYTVFQISMNDILQTPQHWSSGYFGVFTVKKMLLMGELLNIPMDYYTHQVAIPEIEYHGQFMQRYLNEKTAAGETIYEEDGTPMAMGIFVQ